MKGWLALAERAVKALEHIAQELAWVHVDMCKDAEAHRPSSHLHAHG